MEMVLWGLAILLTIGAGLIGIIVLFRILSTVLSASLSVLGFVIGSFLQLLISTLVDIRILSLLAVIFTIMAHFERGSWLWLSFILSSCLFIIAASFVIIFLLANRRKNVLRWTAGDRNKEFWDGIEHLIFLNIGFLGIFYIILSFSMVSYSYFLLSTFDHDMPWVFAGPAGVSFHDFASYTAQTALEAIPFGTARRLGISLSKIEIRGDAYTFSAFVLVFQVLLYFAVFSFVGAIRMFKRNPDQ